MYLIFETTLMANRYKQEDMSEIIRRCLM